MLTAQWNTGWLIGIYVIIVLQIICIFAGAGLAIWLRSWAVGAVAIGIVLILGAIGTAIAFPFSGAYHRYVPISGTVQNVSSRFLGDGNSTTQNYVVTINGTAYRVDDTRGGLLRKGSKVTLMCEKSFQFNASSGWVCNWGKFGLNGGN